MFAAIGLSALLVTINIFVHYEVLRFLSAYVPKLGLAVRVKVLVVVLGCFVAHTIEVWLYALSYMLIDRAGIGSLQGQVDESFADFLYFSATSYSTLGFGDVYRSALGTSIRPAPFGLSRVLKVSTACS